MRNVVGSPVSGEDLFGRQAEVERLWRLLEQGQHVLLVAPRRIGKSSIMKELQRAPKPGWVVFYSDLEGGSGAIDCFADMAAHLALHPETRSLLERLPYYYDLRTQLSRISSVAIGIFRAEVKQAIAGDWLSFANRLRKRLSRLPPHVRLLFVHDELPILLARILEKKESTIEAEQFLSALRTLRQDTALAGRVLFVIGGSIGLAPLLHKHGISAPINDLALFHLKPWPHDIARDFLRQLGMADGFRLMDKQIEVMLHELGEAVPYHVQLLYQSVRDLAKDDPEKVTLELVRQAFADRLEGPHLDHYAERLTRLLDVSNIEIARTILEEVSRTRDGILFKDLAAILNLTKPPVQFVLRLLQSDGYLEIIDDRICFRSNLVRSYWQRHYAMMGER